VVETDTEVRQSFVIPTDEETEFAHRAMVTILGTFTEAQQAFSWRQVLAQSQLPHLPGGPRQAAKNALDAGFLKLVLVQRPQTMPEFLLAQCC
jgi:hypothetical protein